MTLLNGKYEIGRRLGGGGMAEVFLARTVGAVGFSKTVAIKCVLPGFSDRPDFAAMFASEAQLTCQLHHSNIVSVLDFDRDATGRFFLVMEFVDGTDLDGLLQTGELPFGLVIFVAVEILRGLDYAHDLPVRVDGVKGIVHRDISPHNVLVGWDGAVKVSDFGIAKLRSHTAATASVLIKGKPAYMSPEQARGDKLDGRSDLFAVGVMLFEMLSQTRLFQADSNEATLGRVWYAEIPKVRSVRADVPEDLAAVVDWLLQRDLGARAPNAGVVIDALLACAANPVNGRGDLTALLVERFPGRAPVRVRTNPRAPVTAPTIAASPRVTRTAAPPATDGRAPARQTSSERWRPPIVLVALLVLGFAGVAIALILTRSHDDAAIRGNAATGQPTALGAAGSDAGVADGSFGTTITDAGVAAAVPASTGIVSPTVDAGASAPQDASTNRAAPSTTHAPAHGRGRDTGIHEVPLGGQ